MATNSEEMLIRLGIDATSVEAGLQNAVRENQNAANKILGIWKSSADEKKMMSIKEAESLETRITEIEVEAATRRNQARRLLRQREAEEIKRQAVANAEIQQGYVPQTWQTQSAVNKRLGGRGGNAEMVGGMAGGQIASSIEHGESSREIGREIGDMGMYGAGMTAGTMGTRYLMRKFGRTLAKGISEGSKKVIGAIGSFFVGWEVGSWINERFIDSPAEKLGKEMEESKKKMRERLEKQIELLGGAGKLSPEDVEKMKGHLAQDSFQGINAVQKELASRGLGSETKKELEKEIELKRLAEEHAKTLREAQRASMNNEERLAEDHAERKGIYDKIIKATGDEVEQAKLGLELDRVNKQIAEDEARVTEDRYKQEKADIDEEMRLTQEIIAADDNLKEKKRHANKAQDELNDSSNNANRVNPTIEDLAGHSFTEKLHKDYGKGGRFDMNGNNPFADDAQTVLRSREQEKWDIMAGNAEFTDEVGADGKKTGNKKLSGGMAFQDQQRATEAENRLSAAGINTPEMQMKEIAAKIEQSNQLLSVLQEAKSGTWVVQLKAT